MSYDPNQRSFKVIWLMSGGGLAKMQKSSEIIAKDLYEAKALAGAQFPEVVSVTPM
jgi:hypothetical protein